MNQSQSRPYRSHKVPACDRCRNRKVRCIIAVPGRPCTLCLERRWTCQSTGSRHAEKSETAHVPQSQAAKERPEVQPQSVPHRATDEHLQRIPGAHVLPPEGSLGEGTEGESSLIVGPMVAEDVQILHQYLNNKRQIEPPPSHDQPYNMMSNAPGNPIFYVAVPRRREGMEIAKDPGHNQREILDQILGSTKHDVVQLYFDFVHPFFPILDEKMFENAAQGYPGVPSALLCEVYAVSLTYWQSSEQLKSHQCPSSQYFWKNAVDAYQQDFLAPNAFTVYASLLNLSGRPVLDIRGNAVNVGRTVALAHSLGLNRDPSTWKGTTHGKDSRIRLWWGILIHDRWASLAHGTPPSIAQNQYDVPLPSTSILSTAGKESEHRIRAAQSFIELCKLSEILGEALPLVYELKPAKKDISKDLRRLECDLDKWEAGIPETLLSCLRTGMTTIYGSSSLWLGFLSIRMLLCRIALRVFSNAQSLHTNEVRQYRLAMVREAATNVVDFICSLQSTQLREFWLPYTAHLIVSATTVLLRCTVDTTDNAVAESCKDSLRRIQKRLHKAKTDDNWDLADTFMRRCDEPISRLTAATSEAPTALSSEELSGQEADHHGGNSVSTISVAAVDVEYNNLYLPADSNDYPWESLWDMLDGNVLL